ncbi:MAG: hypothetical protein HC893_04225 [Chloroflexaceae bacterium]|nr:hypothetical protein [Chloroflexaceae bacterium]NJL33192.1 hypothetical protein [Chloroflexaceae bacterium]NJO04158.1 hypothetical protein [Chloroflexaceae bacterium]
MDQVILLLVVFLFLSFVAVQSLRHNQRNHLPVRLYIRKHGRMVRRTRG